MIDVKLLLADEWEGLYINEQLVEQGHHIGEGYGLVHVLHPYVNGKEWTWERVWADEDAMDLESGGGFPENWDEVTVEQ